MTARSGKLRAESLWHDANSITEFIYGQIGTILENHPEEKWASASKLRTAASDGLFFISKAVAGTKPEASLYNWDQARQLYFALQAMYLMAGKQHFIELDPDMVVRLDTLLAAITKAIDAAKAEAEAQSAKELEPWLKKYEIWEKLQQPNLK